MVGTSEKLEYPHFDVLRIIKTWKFRKERDAVSTNSEHCLNPNRTEGKLLPDSEDRSCQSNKRAGLRMDDDPVPKALIDAMDDLDDSKPLLEALTRSSLSKGLLITQRKYACQRRAIPLECRLFY